MGGKGSGGARPGSGPKRRDPSASWLAGGKQIKPTRPAAPSVESSEVQRPKGLALEAIAVWNELAPLAIGLRSLTPARAYAFGLLCGWIVLEQKLASSPLAACGPDHRGLMQKVESGLARFQLHGDGKPAVSAEPAKDEWAEFDGPVLVKGGR